MPLSALALVLLSALTHAAWNLMGKQAADADGTVFVWLVAAMSALVWGPAAVAYMLITGEGLTWATAAVVWVGTTLRLAYFLLLQQGYRIGDLSIVYPTARGTGPVVASVVAIALFGERPGVLGVLGVCVIGMGIWLLGRNAAATGHDLAAVRFGLLIGLFIASYTVWDKHAVTTFAVAPILLNYGGEAMRALALTPAALSRREHIAPVWRAHRYRVLGAAVLSPASYLFLLLAFTQGPISAVAPVREVSVVFAVVLGGHLLAEGQLRSRLVAAGIILGGAVAIILG